MKVMNIYYDDCGIIACTFVYTFYIVDLFSYNVYQSLHSLKYRVDLLVNNYICQSKDFSLYNIFIQNSLEHFFHQTSTVKCINQGVISYFSRMVPLLIMLFLFVIYDACQLIISIYGIQNSSAFKDTHIIIVSTRVSNILTIT